MRNKDTNGKIWLISALVAAVAALVAVILGMGNHSFVVVSQSRLEEKVDAMLADARSGNLTDCSSRFAGANDLGEAPSPDTARGKLWYAYLDSISYTADQGYHMEGDRLAFEIHLTCMDMEETLAQMNEVLPEIKKAQVKAKDKSEIFDENGDLRPQMEEEILMEAVNQVLPEAPCVERDMTVYFVRQQGKWMLQPTEGLIALLSGCAE